MKKNIIIILIFVLVQFSFGKEEITAIEIVEKRQEARKIDNLEQISTLTIIDQKGNKRVRKLAMISKMYEGGKIEKKTMKFLAPADVKGSGMLTFDYDLKDDDMWLYLPSLRKTRRIVSSEKSKSFMGSEFSYSDMTSFNINDFTYEIKGEETIDGEECWEIVNMPKNEKIEDEYGFTKKISYISKNDYLPRQILYYNFDQELYKKVEILDVRKIDEKNNKYKAFKLLVSNIENGRKSELIVEKAEIKSEINDEYFTSRFLERK